MLLQTNSYIVPRDKRAEHARLLRRFRQTLLRLGCDHFEVYEQVGANWNTGETTGRFVQIMRFRDRKQQLEVQSAERSDPAAQAVVQEFCELINFPYQQQQGLFAVGFYTSFLKMPPQRTASVRNLADRSGEPDSDPQQDAPMMAEADIHLDEAGRPLPHRGDGPAADETDMNAGNELPPNDDSDPLNPEELSMAQSALEDEEDHSDPQAPTEDESNPPKV